MTDNTYNTRPSWDIIDTHPRYGAEGYLVSTADTEELAINRLRKESAWVQYLELRYKGEALVRSVEGIIEDYRTT